MNDDEVGAAFADALRRLVSDVEPSDDLRKWVRTELRSQPESSSKTRRWSPRRRLVAVLTPTAAAVVAVLSILLGAQAAPSFAVVRIGNGVKITLNDMQGVTGANTKLRRLGVKTITVVPVAHGCKSHLQLLFTGITTHARGMSIQIDPKQIPTGMTDVLAAKKLPDGTIALGIGRVHGLAPSCVAPVKSGVGIPGLPGTP